MKKPVIHAKIAEEAREREKQWKELRNYMENYKVFKGDIGTKKETKSSAKILEKNEKDIERFLKNIGLEMYIKTMLDNGVDDIEVLGEINEGHLEQMGIVLGHRIKIMKKIREFIENSELGSDKDMKNIAIKNSMSTELCFVEDSEKEKNEILLSSKKIRKIELSLGGKKIEDRRKNLSEGNVNLILGPEVRGCSKEIKVMVIDDFVRDVKKQGNKDRWAGSAVKAPVYPRSKGETRDKEMNENALAVNKITVLSKNELDIREEKKKNGGEIGLGVLESFMDKENKNFSYVPYTPSEEIIAVKKSNSRPNSARKPAGKTQIIKENVEIIGW